MRLAPGDVEGRQATVERHRLAEAEHQVGRARGKAAAPGGLSWFWPWIEGKQMRPRPARAQRERFPGPFRFAPAARGPRFGACPGLPPSPPWPSSPPSPPARPTSFRFGSSQVEIKPTTSSLFVATVTMTMPPFTRRDAVFSSTYSARVFPYFFWSESGRIWIEVPAGEAAPGRPGRGGRLHGARRQLVGRPAQDRGARDPDRALGGQDPCAGLRLEAPLPQLRHDLRAPGHSGSPTGGHSQVR